MRVRTAAALACLACAVAVRGAFAFDVTSVPLHLYLSGLKEARNNFV